MIEVEDLFLASSEMDNDRSVAGSLRDEAFSLFKSEEYQRWLTGGLAELKPYELPRGGTFELLDALGLARDGRLRVKLNAIGDRIFVTDGVWVDRRVRVFPFADESQALLGHVHEEGLDEWATVVVDLATGCGHNAIGFRGSASRYAFDVSPRAQAFANFNRRLNDLDGADFLAALRDIRDGIPDLLPTGPETNLLLLANMPFGPAPAAGLLPATSHGGESGIDLQIATLEAIAGLSERLRGRCGLRASLLGLTVGRSEDERWEMVEMAVGRFGRERVRWTLLADEKVFRISGVREQDNPSPVAVAMPRIADCGLYVRDCEREAVRSGYRDLAARLEARGRPEIAYGVVDISIG